MNDNRGFRRSEINDMQERIRRLEINERDRKIGTRISLEERIESAIKEYMKEINEANMQYMNKINEATMRSLRFGGTVITAVDCE